MRINRAEFGHLMVYSPWGGSEEALRSKDQKTRLKNDLAVSGVPASEEVARMVANGLGSLPFSDFFGRDVVLVPMQQNFSDAGERDLWAPANIAGAMGGHGLGVRRDMLYRTKPTTRSHESGRDDRFTATDHYNSIGVARHRIDPKEIVVVDDIITRGDTAMGAVNRLAEAFPDARIRVFAVMRAVSSGRFSKIMCPSVGHIQIDGTETRLYVQGTG